MQSRLILGSTEGVFKSSRSNHIDRAMSSDSPIAPPRRCPICGKPTIPRHRPFCSARCVQIDLGRWLKGSYRIETDEPPEDSDTSADRRSERG